MRPANQSFDLFKKYNVRVVNECHEMTEEQHFAKIEKFKKRPRTSESAHARFYYTRSLMIDVPSHCTRPTR